MMNNEFGTYIKKKNKEIGGAQNGSNKDVRIICTKRQSGKFHDMHLSLSKSRHAHYCATDETLRLQSYSIFNKIEL